MTHAFIMSLLLTLLPALQAATPQKTAARQDQVILRSEPVKLENPDNRSARNAVLQAFTPLMIDTINQHKARTGISLDDQQWVLLVTQKQPTRAELLAIVLGRTVLGLNVFTQASCGATVFNNSTVAINYGHDANSIPLLVQDIVHGINSLTAVKVAYCQLPVDREQMLGFTMDRFVKEQLTASQHELPDYLVIDTAGISLRSLDQHSLQSGANLASVHERSLLPEITIPHGKESVHYSVCSFISLERSGIPYDTNFISRMGAWLRASSSQNNELGTSNTADHLYPKRHATATVCYGDNWFIIDDGCIWKTTTSDQLPVNMQGAALLSAQPGQRAIVCYKKTATVSSAAQPSENMTIPLTKIEGPEGLSLPEQPLFIALGTLYYLLLAILSTLTFWLAWHGAAGWQHKYLTLLFRVMLLILLSPLTIAPWGNALNSAQKYLLARKRVHKELIVNSNAPHQSGLYS